MSPNLTAIANEFDMDNDERDRKLGGDIALAFFLLGAPASLIVGFFADTHDRRKLFGCTVFVGEMACFCTYFVRTYNQLFLCRALTGFSIGGALPVIYSILGDLFGAGDRHIVSACVSFGVGAGISIGQAVAGYIGPLYGWRLPFLVISIPALLCAVLVYFTVEDPKRGAMEGIYDNEHLVAGERNNEDGIALVSIPSKNNIETDIERIDTARDFTADNDISTSFFSWKDQIKTTLGLVQIPTVALSIFQGAPGCVPWGIINVFLTDYLSEDRGFSVQAATTILVCFSAGYTVGLIVGGAGGRILYKLDIRLPALLAGGTAVISCFPMWFLINSVDSTTPYYVSICSAIISGICAAPTGPIVKATLTNVTVPNTRGKAFALFNIADDFGKGLGPYFVSLLIIKLGGRVQAFNVGIFGWFICGVLNLAISFTVVRDEHVVQTTLTAQLVVAV